PLTSASSRISRRVVLTSVGIHAINAPLDPVLAHAAAVVITRQQTGARFDLKVRLRRLMQVLNRRPHVELGRLARARSLARRARASSATTSSIPGMLSWR